MDSKDQAPLEDLVPRPIAFLSLFLATAFVLAPFAHFFFSENLTSAVSRTIRSELFMRALLDSAQISFMAGLLCVGLTIVALALISRHSYDPRLAVAGLALGLLGTFSAIIRLHSLVLLLSKAGPVGKALDLVPGEFLRGGLLYTPLAVLIGMVTLIFPFSVVLLASSVAFQRREPMLAVLSAGGSYVRSFLSAILRPIGFDIGLVCALVTLMALGFFVTPAMLGGPTDRAIGYIVYDLYMQVGDSTAAAGITFVLLSATILVVALFVTVARILTRRRE